MITPHLSDFRRNGCFTIIPFDGVSLLPPANVVCEGYVFTHVCHSVHGGVCMVAPRGGQCAWLLQGGMHGCSGGGMCGCSGGVCVVALGWGGMHGCSRGHVWLLWVACMVALGACMVSLGGVCGFSGGGVHGCSRGGMHGCSRGHVWLLWGGMCGCSGGACVVALGGCAWLLQGGHAWLLQGGCAWLLWWGMRGCSGGHAWLLLGGHAWDTTRYGDTVNERAVRILLECILVEICCFVFFLQKKRNVGNGRIIFLIAFDPFVKQL